MSNGLSQSYSFLPPNALSNCVLWLDAADSSTLTFSGNNITQWNDKSGLNNHATQSTAANGPTYALDSEYPSLLFTRASQQYMIGPSLLNSTSCGIFLVYRSFSSSLTQYIFFDYKKTTGGTGQNYIQHVIVGGARDTAIVYSESPVTMKDSQNVAAPTTRNIYEIIDSPTNTTQNFFQIGTPLNTSFTNGGVANIDTDAYGYTLGTLRTTTVNLTNTFDGYFNEVIVYLREPSTSERQQIEGYLAWKWGLQSSLPNAHPYRNNPPFANNPTIPRSLAPSGPIQMGPTSSSTFSMIYPTNIPGCALWLDAYDTSTIVLSGSNVTQWNDKSGGGFNAVQTTSSYFPTYNLATRSLVCTNDGTNPQFLDVPQGMQTTQPCSIFSVLSWTQYAASGTQFLDKRKAASLLPLYSMSGGGVLFRDNSTLTNTAWTLPQNTQSIIGVQGALNTEQTFVNGTSQASQTNSFNMPAADTYTFRIGALNEPVPANIANVRTFSASSRINEVIVFNAFLSTAQRQLMEGYLAWKWNTQASLPSTHPFKNFPPGLSIRAVPQVRQLVGATFLPTNITGCSLWLDAADPSTIVLSGSSVTQWNDKSGNGRNATASTPPTYNVVRRSIVFNGSTQFMSLPDGTLGTGSTNYSCFFVASTNAPNSPQWVLVQGNTVNGQLLGFFFWATQALFHSWWINEYGFNNVTATATNIIAGFTYDGTTRLTYANATSSTANVPGIAKNTSANDALIGKRLAGEFLNGTVSEIIFYTGFLSTSQRQQIEGYLAWKWGLVSSLPASHPFKKWPPPPA